MKLETPNGKDASFEPFRPKQGHHDYHYKL